MKFYRIFSLALCLLFAFACSSSPTGPDKPAAKDPRQFTWTVDTLHYRQSLQTLMFRIWGS